MTTLVEQLITDGRAALRAGDAAGANSSLNNPKRQQNQDNAHHEASPSFQDRTKPGPADKTTS